MAADPLFVNARLPEDIEKGAKGGPSFLTTVLDLASGYEKRNQEWALTRPAWDIGYGMQTKDDFERVLDFFHVCAGKAHGFRFKDWLDYQIGRSSPQNIGNGNGSATVFQACRIYSVTGVDGSTLYTFKRNVTRLVQGTVKMYLNGAQKTEHIDYSVNYDTGAVTFNAAPGGGVLVNMQAEFDVPVRFDTDVLSLEAEWENAATVPSILIKTLKE